MKNRIISVFLAFTVLVGSLTITKRTHAVAAVGWIITIGIAAWEVLDIMIKGEEPAIIDGIRTLIEEGVDGLTNPDSPFQQTYGAFWKDYGKAFDNLYTKLTEWYENGDLVFKNGAFELSYSQYKDLYNITYSYVPNIGVEFTTPYNYFAFSYTPGSYLTATSLPVNDIYFKSSSGQSYALIYYNEQRVVFSDQYFYFRETDSKFYGSGTLLDSTFHISNIGLQFTNISDKQLEHSKHSFGYSSLSNFIFSWIPLNSTNKLERSSASSFCFVFEDGTLTRQPISSVDITGCNTAIVSSVGSYGTFLQSITATTSIEPVSAELDDLSSVLPVEDNPVLSIPTSPDLSVPIADQVTVSVPGEVDAPLSDYMNPVLTEVSVPSLILTKFPFCIPYDFIRFLGVLAADPIAPVFHIPISTHPSNLEQWADNETIGNLVSSDEPMFNIDEVIVIDFAHIPLVQPICYTVFIVGFVILLIKLTPKLIQH